MATKRCPACEQVKPVNDFYRRTEGGFSSRCKPCHITGAKAYQLRRRHEMGEEAWRAERLAMKERARQAKVARTREILAGRGPSSYPTTRPETLAQTGSPGSGKSSPPQPSSS